MLFSPAEIIFISAFVLMLGGYRLYTTVTGKEGRYSKGRALTWFICAGLDLCSIFLYLYQDIALGDLIPHVLIAVLFALLGAFELRGVKRQDETQP